VSSEDDRPRLIDYPVMCLVACIVGGIILPPLDVAYGWRCMMSFCLWLIAEMVVWIHTVKSRHER
jgi:hypothetical protein